ncbi:enoyl-CoA hydratase/isomerase family protein [Sphingomonas sp. MMSM20]|uniref:enoyl-CoA hydratase/isomerase family protein n=1 Tax=Sphingomonas lycopersici TaxID=2951807 RepID=UPI0022381F54|nr:enoyl-CoA hydratase/isomerase family protein [Sphingomonas lycopersici]MCW6529595.1 enoyl-CoA hydratase/isomerase family protein [Sphingomonas lycopersici]
MTQHIEVSIAHHVATVVIDRPPHNHVNAALIGALADTLEALDRDDACRAIVLATNGRVFCGGADLSGDKVLVTDSGEAETPILYRNAVRLFAARKPTVAAIQGSAVGAGLGLALVADFRVASPEARFSANFVSLGFHAGFGISHTLPRVIGQQKAALMLLTGRRVKAADALAWGLIDELVPADELRAAATALAAEIAAAAPLGVEATRATLRGELAEAVRRQTEHERAEQDRLMATADFREGIRAVAERRPGNFIRA